MAAAHEHPPAIGGAEISDVVPGQRRDLDPEETGRLRERPGPVVAVSAWMRAVPDQIAPFVPAPWASLGTDGFGRSDTRDALRRHRRVDAPAIALTVLEQLVAHGERKPSALRSARATYRLDEPVTATTWTPSTAAGGRHG